MKKEEQPASLEEALKRIEQITESLESENLDMQKAMTLFEEGVTEVRRAQELIASSELKIREIFNGTERG